MAQYSDVTEDRALWRALLQGAGRVGGDARVDPDAAGALLRAQLEEARGLWPQLTLDSLSFMVYLGDRLGRDEQVLEQVVEAVRQGTLPPFLSVSELYLACACATGLPGAVEAFEQRYGGALAALARRFSRAHRPPEDLAQTLREKLFVRLPDRPPRIADYRGVGHLENWLRVAATRAFVDESRRAQRSEREVPTDEAAIFEHGGPDWEVRFLKARYRQAFRQAFTEALGALPAEERSLLRFHTVQGLSIDQLGGLYGIHRSNAARRLARVRDKLLTLTRSELMTRLQINRTEFESIMGLIHSHLDVSVARLLATQADVAPGERS